MLLHTKYIHKNSNSWNFFIWNFSDSITIIFIGTNCYHSLCFCCSIFSFCIWIVGNEKPQRRGSVGSLDSGMSISYTSSAGSRDNAKARLMQQQFQVRYKPYTSSLKQQFRWLSRRFDFYIILFISFFCLFI